MDIKGKKVLLIRLSALGDVVFNIPLANLIKENGAILHWLVSEKGFDIVNNNPCADKVILAPVEKWKKEKNLFKNFLEYKKILNSINQEKYDIVIDTQLILKSFIWMFFIKAKRKIVSKSAREGAIFGGREVIEPLFCDFKSHAIYNYFKFAKYLGLDTSKIKQTLPFISNETKEKVRELLHLDKNKITLTIAPATTWENKHWQKDNWKKLLSEIDTNKYNLIFVGCKKDTDLIEYIAKGDYINLAGKTNLLELIEVFNNTDILISPDSGSCHLAALTQKPKIISIFTSTPKERYAPLAEGNIALSNNLKCSPCHKKKCPRKTNECTIFPTANEVKEALLKIEENL